jgi:hypothetical protein
LDILLGAGGLFLAVKPGSEPPLWEAAADPHQRVQEDGSFYFAEFAHPLLSRSLVEPVVLGQFPPTCSISYDVNSRTLRFGQTASEEEPENLDTLAHGQLALAEKLYPLFRPRLAFIDEVSDALDEKKVLCQPLRESGKGIPYIFWANFLPPTATEATGSHLFFDAPGWRSEHLQDGGILYVTTESFFRWWTAPPRTTQKYWQSRHVNLPLYNSGWLIAGFSDGEKHWNSPGELEPHDTM